MRYFTCNEICFVVQGTTVHTKPTKYTDVTYEQAVDTMAQYEFHSSDEDVTRPKSPVSIEVLHCTQPLLCNLYCIFLFRHLDLLLQLMTKRETLMVTMHSKESLGVNTKR